MSAKYDVLRRDFLKSSTLAGGGLLIGFAIPGASRLAAAAGEFKPNAFIRITPDNRVTVICGLSEMGQGVLTAIPMLVAEELEADWSSIKVEQAPADPVFKNSILGFQGTGGSTAVRANWEPMRKAGAAAREMLIGAAAATWNVDKADCRAEKSMVLHKSGKKLSYGQLAARAAQQPVPKEVKLKEAKQFKIIGTSVKRLDTAAKVNGTAVFGMDVRVPGMLTAVVARSPVAGGKVASFNADKAKVLPGVKHVVQIGSGVAVVADNYWNAKQGRDALEIKWDDGAGALLSSEGIRKTFGELAEKPGTLGIEQGDANAALAGAAKKLEAVYEAPYLAHACMEPMNCTASVKADSVEIWGSVQFPGLLQQLVLSQVAGVKPEQVKVTTTMLGGGFGRRTGLDFAIDAVLTSKAVGVPVHVVFPREDDIRGHHYRPASVAKFQGALDAAGNPAAARIHAVCSSIADAAQLPYEANGLAPMKGVDGFSVEGLTEWPYATPNLQVEWTKNEPPVGVWFWRSVGHSQNIFFVEGFMDEMAVAADKDPYQYRRALLGKNPRYKGVLELAADKAGWGKPLPAGRGRGIAVGQSFGSFVAEVAEVSVGKDGKIRVHQVVCAVDCGSVVNPGIVKRQMESAIVFGLSAALYGEITFKDGKVEQSNFHDYPVLRMNQMPKVEVHIVSSTEAPGGVGEPGLPPLAPAVANAVYAATGKRLRKLPLRLA